MTTISAASPNLAGEYMHGLLACHHPLLPTPTPPHTPLHPLIVNLSLIYTL